MRAAARLGILLLAALPGAPALAEPFCVSVQGLPDQCIYVDGGECQRRASQLGGVCVVNGAQITTPPGPGKFCLAASGHAVSCVYVDRGSCIADADRRHTACVGATAPPQEGVDPFAVRRPY